MSSDTGANPIEMLPAGRAGGEPTADQPPDLRALPKELGVMLLSAGVIGFVMPGPGTPAIIAGGLVLWPSGFGKVEGWVQRRFPDAHRNGMKQLKRYLSDLDRRYPWRKTPEN